MMTYRIVRDKAWRIRYRAGGWLYGIDIPGHDGSGNNKWSCIAWEHAAHVKTSVELF